jgi:hypothetical protein
MKIIFLDIDGVLNSHSTQGGEHGYRLDSAAALRLNTLARQTGARIVVTSDWRRYYGLQRCTEILCAHGVSVEIIDATPNLEKRAAVEDDDDFEPTEYFQRLRRSEIESWIEAHEVHGFVVLDDLAVFDRDHPNMVQTDAELGLTEEDALRAATILGLL